MDLSGCPRGHISGRWLKALIPEALMIPSHGDIGDSIVTTVAEGSIVTPSSQVGKVRLRDAE